MTAWGGGTRPPAYNRPRRAVIVAALAALGVVVLLLICTGVNV